MGSYGLRYESRQKIDVDRLVGLGAFEVKGESVGGMDGNVG